MTLRACSLIGCAGVYSKSLVERNRAAIGLRVKVVGMLLVMIAGRFMSCTRQCLTIVRLKKRQICCPQTVAWRERENRRDTGGKRLRVPAAL